jgi:hypothetical protein
MADTMLASPAEERTNYQASGGRKTFFSITFLLLLPFFASLPAMLYMRLSHGLWHDTLPLVIVGAGFTVLMFLLFIELLFSLRSKVEMKDDAVKLTLPQGRGPTPMLRYKTHEIPYSDIKAVETRREIYGGTLAPMMLQGACLITKDDRRIPLGFVAETNVDPAFPYPLIGRQIAARAGVPVIDEGHVWRSARHQAMGFVSQASGENTAPAAGPLTEEDVEMLNSGHQRVITGLVAVLVLLVAAGIAVDVMSL